MHQSKLKRISLGVFLAFLPLAASAAGLGRLNVMSGLGEPLSAEIEVLSTTPDELSELTAAIASSEAYNLQGIERPPLHSAIKVEVKKKANGSPVIKLSTSQPITDPFLDMLVQVDWPTGRLLREFTLLLDPPGYANQGANNTVSSPVVNSTASTATSTTSQSMDTAGGSGADKPARKKSKKLVAQPEGIKQDNPPAATSSDSSSVTTARGDTLSSIATQNQVDGVSLDQMLIGIYRANKNAFVAQNINRLKAGQLIRIPAKDELQSVSKSEASEEIRVHTNDWKAYRNKLAGVVAESAPSNDDSSNNQSAGGKITTKAEDKAAPAVTGPRDVVKLSKNDTGAGSITAADAKSMQDKIAALKEDATARENSIKEANDRAATLEKQIQDMQKLLAMKSQAMSQLQKNAEATPSEPVEQPKTEPAKTEAPKPDDVKPEVAAPAATTPEPVPPANEVVTKPEPPKPESAKTEEKKVVVPVTPPAPIQEPSILDSLTEDPLVLGGAGLVALLVGGWLFMRNKRKRGLDGFEKSILTSGGLKANTVFGNTLGGSVDTGDTSFLTDFSQSSGGMIDTNDVDPIAEAEVYMAYGRDRQAEEILRDAISKEPKRYELHMKLLEVYAARSDASAFEAMAGEMYTSLGTSDPVWAKVAEIGRKLEPDNPLYQISGTVENDDFAATNSRLAAADFDSVDPVSKPSLDFSVDEDVPLEVAADSLDSESVPAEEQVETSLDFDLGLGEEELDQTVSFEAADVSENDTELDFQLDMDVGEEAATEEVAIDTATELSSISADDADSGTPDTESTMQFDLGKQETASSIDFEIPEFGASAPEVDISDVPVAGVDSIAQMEVEEFEPAFEAAVPEISFDLPDASVANEVAGTPAAKESDLPDFDKTMIINTNTTAEDIVFGAAPEDSSGLDLNFDVDLGTLQTPEDSLADTKVMAPEVDLSGISFDLDEDVTGATKAEDIAELDASEIDSDTPKESSEVDTKLDLVTAYIDMGDNEGAKELLEEVMKEGGPQQRLRANDILKGLS
ncbi:MAG TPA: FimV/HubP family polar landmark protein [Methylophilaceae bacterium]|nr:FimV/HubP family polar landmark protein [Methylophilaceae bacterium]